MSSASFTLCRGGVLTRLHFKNYSSPTSKKKWNNFFEAHLEKKCPRVLDLDRDRVVLVEGSKNTFNKLERLLLNVKIKGDYLRGA